MSKTETWKNNMYSIERKLNKLVTPFFNELEKELSKNCINPTLDLMPGDVFIVPRILGLGAHQTWKNSEEAINLNEIRCGAIKDIVIKKEDHDIFLLRSLFGYVPITRMIETKSVNDIKLLVKQSLMTLEQFYGFGPETPHVGTYGTFKRPGGGNILTLYEEAAAFELRLFGNAISCIDKELLK